MDAAQILVVEDEMSTKRKALKAAQRKGVEAEAAGIEPVEIESTTDTTAPHFAANPSQNNALQHLPISTKQPDSTAPRQNHNDSQQQIWVPGVYENSLPEDLVHVMPCWSHLPNNLKRQILALLRHH